MCSLYESVRKEMQIQDREAEPHGLSDIRQTLSIKKGRLFTYIFRYGEGGILK